MSFMEANRSKVFEIIDRRTFYIFPTVFIFYGVVEQWPVGWWVGGRLVGGRWVGGSVVGRFDKLASINNNC